MGRLSSLSGVTPCSRHDTRKVRADLLDNAAEFTVGWPTMAANPIKAKFVSTDRDIAWTN